MAPSRLPWAGELPRAVVCDKPGAAAVRAGVTILALPLTLGLGSAMIVHAPTLLPVLVTNAFDQSFRFSVDRPT
jgi:hypothetical protein